MSPSVTTPLGQYLKKFQYLGYPVLGSTLEHMQWEESKGGLSRNLRASPNEYRYSEETQVKKALFCRGPAFCKGDSRCPPPPRSAAAASGFWKG